VSDLTAADCLLIRVRSNYTERKYNGCVTPATSAHKEPTGREFHTAVHALEQFNGPVRDSAGDHWAGMTDLRVSSSGATIVFYANYFVPLHFLTRPISVIVRTF
jgi:hypothetical protein